MTVQIDISELPHELSANARRPMLHAYKFLAPQFDIRLDVKVIFPL